MIDHGAGTYQSGRLNMEQCKMEETYCIFLPPLHGHSTSMALGAVDADPDSRLASNSGDHAKRWSLALKNRPLDISMEEYVRKRY